MERDEWESRYAASGLLWTAEPNQFVVRELSDLAPGKALDVAAGQGRNAIWLADRGWRVTAVDFAGTALETARRLAADRGVDVEWVHTDVRQYVPEPGSFQLVLIAYLHLPPSEMAAVLHRSAAALAPGGTMLVIGHDLTNLREGTGGPQDPAVLHTPELTAAELDALQIVRAERVRRRSQTQDGPRDAIDSLVRAIRSLSKTEALDKAAGMRQPE